MTKPVFQGISLSTSFLEKVNDKIKTYIEYERPASYVISRTLKLMEDISMDAKKYKLCTIPY